MNRKLSLTEKIRLAENNAVDFMHACVTIALHDEYEMGVQRLRKVNLRREEINEEMLEVMAQPRKSGREQAEAGQAWLVGLLPEGAETEFRVPLGKGAARKQKELQIRMAVDNAATLEWRVYAAACAEVLGFGAKRLNHLHKAVLENFRQLSAWALEDGVDYDDLMNVRMDDGGQVSLLSANTMRMNALAERAGDAALRKLETVSAQKVDVPLGAALGLTLLAGSGPRIPISIVPVGSVQTDFETEFEACGINQTRHKVYLQLSASIRIVIPTGAKTTNVTANMLVAESIIVGKVPESFVGYRLSEEELNMAP